jgi:glycosyltransferase involved in cell wall biosynthesis
MDFTLPHLLKDGDYPVGGWAIELNAWLRGLTDEGHAAGVLTFAGAKAYVDRSLPFDLIEAYDPDRGLKVLKYGYAYIPGMIRAARRFRPDVLIQACASVHTGMMAVTALRLGAAFVYRAVNDSDVEGRYRSRMPLYAQKAYEYGVSRAGAVVCQNQYQQEKFAGWVKGRPTPIIYNPFQSADTLQPPRPRSERSYVAWLGVFQPQKNLPLLLSVARRSPDIPFRIGGMPSTSEMDDATTTALAALRELPNVAFAGYVKRSGLSDFLSGAVALLSTSHYEGFSNTFLEAFDAGTPIVAPRRVDPDLIITRNALGFTAEADDQLATLLRRAFELPVPQFDAFGTRSRAYVRAEHSPTDQTRKLIAVLEPLMQPRRG